LEENGAEGCFNISISTGKDVNFVVQSGYAGVSLRKICFGVGTLSSRAIELGFRNDRPFVCDLETWTLTSTFFDYEANNLILSKDKKVRIFVPLGNKVGLANPVLRPSSSKTHRPSPQLSGSVDLVVNFVVVVGKVPRIKGITSYDSIKTKIDTLVKESSTLEGVNSLLCVKGSDPSLLCHSVPFITLGATSSHLFSVFYFFIILFIYNPSLSFSHTGRLDLGNFTSRIISRGRVMNMA
jgi:hypothetical protein